MVRALLALLLTLPSLGSASEAEPPALLLKAKIEGTPPFFSGERVDLVYEIYYRGEINLTREELPFLEPEGLHKIGGPEIEERSLPPYTVQTIRQRVELPEPGLFSFPPSLIEGHLLERDPSSGAPTKELVRASAPPLTLEVSPFPAGEAPPSFTGSVGRYRIEAKLLSPSPVSVNQAVRVEVLVHGEGNLEALLFPPLSCQPGLSGFFDFSKFPPVGEIEAGRKRFELKLYPLSSQIQEVPSLAFSYFNPASGRYETAESAPLALEVEQAKEPLPPPKEEEISQPWEELLSEAPPLNLELEAGEAKLPPQIPWIGIAALFAAALLLILLQLSIQKLLLKREKRRPSFEELISFAASQPEGSAKFYRAIGQLVPKGKEGEALLKELEKSRYGGFPLTKSEILKKVNKSCGKP